MSRSNKSETAVNPAVKFIEWNSEKGCFKYYDKATKKNIDIPLPTKFYVLDILKTIKGFSDSTQNGIWSNEVKNLSKQAFKVVTKSKDGKFKTLSEGIYSATKDKIKSEGGKFTMSVYAAMVNDQDEYEIVNFQLKGAALSGWVTFENENRNSVLTDEVICDDFSKEKKGATKYTVPVFRTEKATEEGNDAAIELDIQLQEYLTSYFANTKSDVETEVDEKEYALPKEFDEDPDDESPFK